MPVLNVAAALPDGPVGWSDTIQQGTYDGLAFDFVSTQDEFGRVVDRQQIPNRDGKQLVNRAAEGRVFDVLAIFVEDDYPDVMNQLIAKINAGGDPVDFVHPVHGRMKALITHATLVHNADDSIDSATMQLRIEEHTTGATGPQATRTSTAAKANGARNAVLDVLNAITAYGAAVESIPGVTALAVAGIGSNSATNTVAATVAAVVSGATSAANLTSSAADALEQNGDEMSAIEVQAQANTVLSAIDATVQVISACTLGGTPVPEQYDLLQSLIAMSQATRDLADVVAAGKPALTTYTVDADIPLMLWVHAKYGDSSRTGEVLALNPWISDPMNIAAGCEITAYAA